MISDLFYLIKFIIFLLILLVASFFDIRYRIVPPKLWILALIVLIPLNLYEFLLFNYDLLNYLISILLTVLISLALPYLGFGGADSKALIALALFFPVYPKFYYFPFFKCFLLPLALVTLINSVIFAPLISIYLFIINLKKLGLHNLNVKYFVGMKVNIENIPKFCALLEYIDEKGNFKRSLKGVEPSNSIIRNMKEAGIKEVWITPLLPFIVFITIGYIISVILGNLLFLLLDIIIHSST